jgi:hypothetical protein
MTERRYNDEEVAAIFLKAAEGPQTPPLHAPGNDGLTLTELQDIGREVGIRPDAVAQAAQTLEARSGAVSPTFLGLPIGVEHTVALERRLSDEEWEQLVVTLREVFDARGKVRADGSFREWTNGNLQALLEPTATGHRLRLRTMKGNARASMRAGLALLGASAAVGLASAAGSQFGAATPGMVFLLAAGLGMFANGALRLPGWARLRRRQMESIAAKLAPRGGTRLPPTP